MQAIAAARRRRTRVVALACVVLPLTLVAPRAEATTPTEYMMAWYINHERVIRGIPAMHLYEPFTVMAHKHSAAMAAKNLLYHNPYLVAWLSPWPWKIIGENVGYGWGVYSLHLAFMASPAHRSNILDPRFRYFGVGNVWSGGKLWTTVIFYG